MFKLINPPKFSFFEDIFNCTVAVTKQANFQGSAYSFAFMYILFFEWVSLWYYA